MPNFHFSQDGAGPPREDSSPTASLRSTQVIAQALPLQVSEPARMHAVSNSMTLSDLSALFARYVHRNNRNQLGLRVISIDWSTQRVGTGISNIS